MLMFYFCGGQQIQRLTDGDPVLQDAKLLLVALRLALHE